MSPQLDMDALIGRSRRPKTQQTRKPGKADDFQTPAWVLDALLEYVPRDYRVWEPAEGQGNLVRGLIERDYEVIGSDIRAGQDYLAWEPEHWDVAITNPPFALKDEFLIRAYQLGRPFAFLLPHTVREGRVRQTLFRRHGIQTIHLPRRVEFTTPSGKVGGSWFAVGWYTWGLGVPAGGTWPDHEEMR